MIFDNIQRMAKERGVTIQKVEQECGLSNGIINKWKENNNPKIDNLKRVADYFGKPIEYFLEEQEA